MSTVPPTSSNLTPDEKQCLEEAEHHLVYGGNRCLTMLCETIRRLDCALTGALGFAKEPPHEYTAADFKPTRQYFHKVNACPAGNPSADNCICWHDEGTGPYPEARDTDPYHGGQREWRDKPARDITKEVFPEQDNLPPTDPVTQLTEELRAVIHRCRMEHDIQLAAYIGALEMIKLALFQDEVVPNPFE